MDACVSAIAPPIILKVPSFPTAPPKLAALTLLLFWSAAPAPTVRAPPMPTSISGACAATAGAVVFGLPVLSAALCPSIVTPDSSKAPFTVKSAPVYGRFALSPLKPSAGGFVGTE